MQKVITPNQSTEYTRSIDPKTQETGCASRAEDVVPFTNNAKEEYNNLRLDYNGTVFKEIADNNGDVLVMRFKTDAADCPSNSDYPKMDASQPWNKPPCTGTGFTGSKEHLIPEYSYGLGKDIVSGAIYKIDVNGNETMVAIWNHGRFEKCE